MLNIRNNVFETNSSSSHSIILRFPQKDKLLLEPLVPNKKGQIILNGGNFASIEFDVHSMMSKLNMIAVYITVTNDKDLKNRFEKVVKEYSGASEIIYNIRMSATDDNPTNSYWSPQIMRAHNYYYDNETDEETDELIEEIIKNEESLKTFLFSKNAFIFSEIKYG